jgi:hypothetical protein
MDLLAVYKDHLLAPKMQAPFVFLEAFFQHTKLQLQGIGKFRLHKQHFRAVDGQKYCDKIFLQQTGFKMMNNRFDISDFSDPFELLVLGFLWYSVTALFSSSV